MARTRKQPYRGSRRFDSSCRSHGGCSWCEGNRFHGTRKRELSAEDQLRELQEEEAEEFEVWVPVVQAS